MREMKLFILSLLVFLLLFPESNAQLSVGVSPPSLDLGEIEAGTSKIVKFNVVTVSKEISVVRLSATRGSTDLITRKDILLNLSEEDTSSWVEFISNPVKLKKTETSLRTGGRIRGTNEITFILHVPKDAEPGYHIGLINLHPVIPASSRMLTIQSIVPLTFIFKVPGKAVREGRIMELSSGRYNHGRLAVNVYFKNTGTVTLRPKPAKIEIFDENNKPLASLMTDYQVIKPGEIKRLTAFWSVNGIKIGDYNATAEVNYLTGISRKESTIQLYKPSLPPARVIEKPTRFPWWVLALIVIILFIAYMIFKRR